MLDKSFGMIPFRIKSGVIELLVVWQNYRGGYWTFPKGHQKDRETHLETALRELKEETGLIPESLGSIISSAPLIQEYSFTVGNMTISRKIEYFLVSIEISAEVKIATDEVTDFRWVTLDDFKRMRPFPELIKTAEIAHRRILARVSRSKS